MRQNNIKDKIKEIFFKLKNIFSSKDSGDKISFSELVKNHHESDRVGAFIPLLHLDNKKKLNLTQEEHFGEIDITLYK